MTNATTTYRGGVVFDGVNLLENHALQVAGGRVVALVHANELPDDGDTVDLAGDIISPGYVDLQVNGGGGALFNDDQSASALQTIAAAHGGLGATTILPTLITDTRERTRAAIDAAVSAIQDGVPGIGGLHLEGPHLSIARKGAHDPALIRAMDDDDLAALLEARKRLPSVMITVAPESVTQAQITAMAEAGIAVSLGHTDADFETCMAYQKAGASCVTHLFNAMSQLGNRAPGAVGAALDSGGLAAGLIADGVHVHTSTIRSALAAKRGPEQIFLVSDAMSPAGTDQGDFVLNGRAVRRVGGRLLLEDGTLAGADLDLTTAINVLTRDVGVSLAKALAMATSIPARVAGLGASCGTLSSGAPARLIRLSRTDGKLALKAVI